MVNGQSTWIFSEHQVNKPETGSKQLQGWSWESRPAQLNRLHKGLPCDYFRMSCGWGQCHATFPDVNQDRYFFIGLLPTSFH